jgi:hypothetical protein
MPAKSKSQQRLFGIIRAIQEGKAPPGRFSKKIRDMAKKIDPGDAKEFASTKTKGLPEKKAAYLDKAFALGFIYGMSE